MSSAELEEEEEVFKDSEDMEDLYHSKIRESIPKTADWQTAGLLMIADVVGCGVMSLATAFAQLGWMLAIPSLLFWTLVSMYVGLLIGEVNEAYPDCENFMQLSGLTLGKDARMATAVCVYSFIFLCLGDYLLILGETLEMMVNSLEETTNCGKFAYTVLTFVVLLPFCQIRQLGKTNWLMVLNSLTVLLSVAFALVGLYMARRDNVVHTEWIASNLSVFSFFHSQALLAFSFSGAFIYLEIVSEMAHPKDFRKALLWCSVPFQSSLYAITGIAGYLLIGSESQGLLIKQVPRHESFTLSALYQLSALGLFIHMCISFVVKSTILARAVHVNLFPSTANDFESAQSKRMFMGIGASLIGGCFCIANVIPYFDLLTGLLGAFQTPLIGFLLPIAFAMQARRKREVIASFSQLKPWEKSWVGVICMFMCGVFVFGVSASVASIVAKWTSEDEGLALYGCLTK